MWGVRVTSRPLFTLGKDPVPIVQEAGWAPGLVWTGAENFAPTGIRSPDRIARNQSLYRLRYPAHSNYTQPTCKQTRNLLKAGCNKWTEGISLNLRKLCDNVGLNPCVWGWTICRHRLWKADFWSVEPFGLMETLRRFVGTCCISPVPVKMEVPRSSEPSVIFCQTARWHILEDCVLYELRCLQLARFFFTLMHCACNIQSLEHCRI